MAAGPLACCPFAANRYSNMEGSTLMDGPVMLASAPETACCSLVCTLVGTQMAVH